MRLENYDYSQAGLYFVTICSKDRKCIFGKINDGIMVLNPNGINANQCWCEIPDHYQNIYLDAFIIMPNHIHGIIEISDRFQPVGKRHAASLPVCEIKTHTLGMVIGSFKSAVSRQINMINNTPGAEIWQRNFYDHIIRDDNSLQRIRGYIEANPYRWPFDNENPENE
jgi:REP element-mobilizing transposase RayT